MENEILTLKDLLTCVIAAILLVAGNKIRTLTRDLKRVSSEPKRLCNDCEKCLYYQTYNETRSADCGGDMERDLRAEGWGPEDCYPGSDAGSNSACIAGLCADFRATRGQLEIAENRIAELIEDKRRIEARAKWAEMMLSDWYAKVLTPEVFDQEIRAWLERIGAIEP